LPLEFAFAEMFERKNGLGAAEKLIDILFAFDILINFRTAYIND